MIQVVQWLRRAPKFLMIGEVETMDKIKMTTPVEMDGDEMTRVLWAWIKGKADPALRGPENGVL